MSVNLSPIGGAAWQFSDNNGNPLSGGKLYTYAAGTTTPLATYTTVVGDVAHTNPIILDSAGRVPNGQIWLTDGSVDYKFVLKTSVDVLVGTYDNIPPAISGSAADIEYLPAGTGAVATTVQGKLRESKSGLDYLTLSDALQHNGAVLLNKAFSFTGTQDVASQQINGITVADSTIGIQTALTTDYGLLFGDYAEINRVTLNHTASPTGVVNGRSNCAILMGAQLSSDDSTSDGARITDTKVNYLDTSSPKRAGNTVAGFGNVSNVRIQGLDITTNATTGLQFHWGYSADALSTNHPRNITIDSLNVTGSAGNSTVGFYLSACHNVQINSGRIKDVDQGIIIGAGDVGGARNPGFGSAQLVMSAISIENVTIENVKNDAILINGASYVLGAAVDPVYTNQRWIAADEENTGVSLSNVTIVRGANSSNNAVSLIHFRNLSIENMSVGLKGTLQALDTTEALTLTACVNSNITLNSHCVTSVNGLSGIGNNLVVNHANTDTANATSQNGITLRGSIVNATTAENVAIGATSIVLVSVTAEIHRGMQFQHGGVIFTFAGHARLDSIPANNLNVKVPIFAAPASIAAGQVIEQFFGMQDTVINGRIAGMNKGIRIISTDIRIPSGIEINTEFFGNVASDIEVPVGITIKYKGSFYYNDNLATMTFKGGVALQTTVISYKVINGKRLGNSAAIPVNGTWARGDVLINRNAAAAGKAGWICTTAGSPGTWKPFGAIDA